MRGGLTVQAMPCLHEVLQASHPDLVRQDNEIRFEASLVACFSKVSQKEAVPFVGVLLL